MNLDVGNWYVTVLQFSIPSGQKDAGIYRFNKYDLIYPGNWPSSFSIWYEYFKTYLYLMRGTVKIAVFEIY